MMPNSTICKNKDVLNSSVQYIKGVGPKRAQVFDRIGIKTVRDLLFLMPRRYEDRSNLKSISQVTLGQYETVIGKVIRIHKRRVKRGMWIFQVVLSDDTGLVHAVWFNQPYLEEKFNKGDVVIFYGKVQLYDRKLQLQSPEFEIIDNEDVELTHMGKIVPIYPLTESLKQGTLRSIIHTLLETHIHAIEETISSKMRDRLGLIGLQEALLNIHFPDSMKKQSRSYRRLVFDEFFLFQLAILTKKARVHKEQGISHAVDGSLYRNFIKNLPFTLTSAQVRVLDEITQDLEQSHPMNRLVQGDVGCGKTIVAVGTLLMGCDSGYQGVFMAPTELLARQHYKNIKKLAVSISVRIELLIGDMKKADKNALLTDLKAGKIDIVIGTHSLLEESVEFDKLGVVVIDEQHKFGVTQRSKLRCKGITPDVLVMTATPIPRTLSLTVYGDLEVSVIDELPPGRQKVFTYWIYENKLADAYNFIKKQVTSGRQAYIIYPVIEQSSKTELKAAVQMTEELKKVYFCDVPLDLIHGRMKSGEREDIMSRFYDGEIKVLVSTTVIEVGIDVPNATVILIENAERFGLAQLHQLRGRIARSSHKAYCILEGKPTTDEAKRRLNVMKSTSDGFKIAEEDLAIRGPGEFFGERQHGLTDFKIGNIVSDYGIMQEARAEAQMCIMHKGDNTKAEYDALRKAFVERYRDTFDLISVG
ncbi:MAG: ATP-dependent DNA helicase RecG [Candidatus Ancaeobacter aquaticus]|nr:ATP-dependent DNA helicase RecG [Candidatus Ancaeobacter aquaticus]